MRSGDVNAAGYSPRKMTKRKTWVLDTGTKGTGAEMVPLDKVLREPGRGAEPAVVSRRRRRRRVREAVPRSPRRFKVVDVMTGQVRGEDIDARTALGLLAGAESLVDVRVYVWQPQARRWRLLTLAEQKAMWERRRNVR
jgi:hypothetical protein